MFHRRLLSWTSSSGADESLKLVHHPLNSGESITFILQVFEPSSSSEVCVFLISRRRICSTLKSEIYGSSMYFPGINCASFILSASWLQRMRVRIQNPNLQTYLFNSFSEVGDCYSLPYGLHLAALSEFFAARSVVHLIFRQLSPQLHRKRLVAITGIFSIPYLKPVLKLLRPGSPVASLCSPDVITSYSSVSLVASLLQSLIFARDESFRDLCLCLKQKSPRHQPCSFKRDYLFSGGAWRGNLQTSLSDDEELARILQQQEESANGRDEENQEYQPMQVNRSYIPQRNDPSSSRSSYFHNDDGEIFLGHQTHSPSNISHNTSSANEDNDHTNMTYEELNELEDSMGDVGRGLSQERISRLRTHNYGTKPKISCWFKKKKFVADDSQCTICLVEYEMGDKITTLPCNHIYHKDCIAEWLKRNKACCVCKAEVHP